MKVGHLVASSFLTVSGTICPTVAVEVSPQRIRDNVAHLADFGTRHSLSGSDDAGRGIDAARSWLVQHLQSSTAETTAKVETIAFTVQNGPGQFAGHTLQNIVVTVPGTVAADENRVVAVLAHYDSVNADGKDAIGDAPGANLNASGVAGVLELVQWFAHNPAKRTIVFALTDGGEHGGGGARAFANMAQQRDWSIVGAFVMAAIGDPRGLEGRFDSTRFRVFSAIDAGQGAGTTEAGRSMSDAAHNGPSRELARYVQFVAQTQQESADPWIVSRPARIGAQGDHLVLNRAGIPAVEITQLWDNYDRQRVNVRELYERPYGDVPEFVDEDYIAAITQLVGLSVTMLANAPEPPRNVRLDASRPMYHSTLEWEPSSSPDTAGYEVAVRSVDDDAWIAAIDAGNATRITLERHRDVWVFAVRAYDEQGNRSLPVYAIFDVGDE